MMLRLILVDDHAIVRHAIAQMIESLTPWTILAQCHDAPSLLRALEVEHPDVIVLDMNMPGMHGLDLIEHLRSHCPGVAIVVLSMVDSEPIVRRALSSGARGYVLKASDFQVLKTAIESVGRGQSYVDPALVVPLLSPSSPGTATSPATLLSRRELQVLELLAQGLSVTDIADKLFVSIKTISTHKSNIMHKLQLPNTMALFQYAASHGLLTIPQADS